MSLIFYMLLNFIILIYTYTHMNT